MAHLQSPFAVWFIRRGNVGVAVDIAVECAREEQEGEGAEWALWAVVHEKWWWCRQEYNSAEFKFTSKNESKNEPENDHF